MRALFGVVSLLAVLAVVGLLVAKQMKAVGAGQLPGAAAASLEAAKGNVPERSRQLQQRVKEDVTRALEQGAASRAEAADR